VFGTDTTPVKLKPEESLSQTRVFDNWGQSLDAFEKIKGGQPVHVEISTPTWRATPR